VLDETNELGGQLIAISPQLPDDALDRAERISFGLEVVSDLGNDVARRYGIVHPMLDYLRKHYSHLPGHNGADYRRRAEPADALAALCTMPREELSQ
jgi:hypothetical protein